jgi:hypothetical protein
VITFSASAWSISPEITIERDSSSFAAERPRRFSLLSCCRDLSVCSALFLSSAFSAQNQSVACFACQSPQAQHTAMTVGAETPKPKKTISNL